MIITANSCAHKALTSMNSGAGGYDESLDPDIAVIDTRRFAMAPYLTRPIEAGARALVGLADPSFRATRAP